MQGRAHQGGDLLGGELVPVQQALGQQVVGVDGVGGVGPAGPGPQTRQGRAERAPGLIYTGHDRADDDDAVDHRGDRLSRPAQGALGRPGGGARLLGGPQDDDDRVAAGGDQAVAAQLTALVAQAGGAHGVQGGAGDEGDDGALAGPAGGAGAGDGVLGGVVEHGVDGHGLQPRVPGPAGLGGAGVHLRRGEADVAPEGQRQDGDGVVVLGGHRLRGLLDDDVEDGAHEAEGLPQGDGAR